MLRVLLVMACATLGGALPTNYHRRVAKETLAEKLARTDATLERALAKIDELAMKVDEAPDHDVDRASFLDAEMDNHREWIVAFIHTGLLARFDRAVKELGDYSPVRPRGRLRNREAFDRLREELFQRIADGVGCQWRADLTDLMERLLRTDGAQVEAEVLAAARPSPAMANAVHVADNLIRALTEGVGNPGNIVRPNAAQKRAVLKNVYKSVYERADDEDDEYELNAARRDPVTCAA